MSEEKEQVRLWCKHGEHYWYRESQRGKRPHNCDQHRPVIERKTQRLWCENGEHWWERNSAKGRPANCAEHRREKARPTPVVISDEASEADDKDARAQARAAAETPFPAEQLANDEDRRIVEYINNELASGTRDADSIKTLRKRRDEVVKHAQRREGTRELTMV